MRTTARIGITAAAIAATGGLAALAQPERQDRTGRQPATGKFYSQYHITQSDDGRRVYLWGFDPETGESVAVASEALPEDINDWGNRPGNFRDYFFAHAEDGRRIYVWGYNPGEARFRLVSTAGAKPDRPAPGTNKKK